MLQLIYGHSHQKLMGLCLGVEERLAKICATVSGFGRVEVVPGVVAARGFGGVSSPSPKSSRIKFGEGA